VSERHRPEIVPAAADQSANAVLQDTSRQDVGTVFLQTPAGVLR
jgi:hypothetical protein